MHLHEDTVTSLVQSDEFAQDVARRLAETSTWADADLDVVDGSLVDVIRAVLEAL